MTKNKNQKQIKCPHCKKMIGKLLIHYIDVWDDDSKGGVDDTAAVRICPKCRTIIYFEENETLFLISFALTAIGKKIGALSYDSNQTLRDVSGK